MYRKPDLGEDAEITHAFGVHIGSRMEAIRKALGKTRTQVGAELDMSSYSIQMYEAGKRPVQLSMLPLLARSLECNVEDLVAEFRFPSGEAVKPENKPEKPEKPTAKAGVA